MADDNLDIKIKVATNFVDDQSDADLGRFVFAYTITIENIGEVSAKQEVSGDGVVGKQPHLNPGETFRYSSGAVLDTPVGSMYGSYRMLTDNGADYDAPIAPFTLAVPGILH